MNKFIYAYGDKARDVFLDNHYRLLKSDKKNNIYVFENKAINTFSFENVDFVTSDTLTF